MIVKRFRLAHGTVLVNVFVNAVARCGHDIAENSIDRAFHGKSTTSL